MGIRNKLNENPIVSVIAAIVVIGLAGVLVWWSMKPTEYGPATQLYFTVDDGKSLFVDDAKKISFTKDGQLAVRAYVYTCDGGSSRFVGYLERLPEGVEAPAADSAKPEPVAPAKNEAEARARAAQASRPAMGRFTTMVKKPGDTAWIKPGDAKYFPTISPACPNGKGTLDRVFP